MFAPPNDWPRPFVCTTGRLCGHRPPKLLLEHITKAVGLTGVRMGTPQKAVAYIEIDDYLVLEATSAHKHEFLDGVAYFSPSWTAFHGERGRDFSVIVDGVSV